MAFHFYFKRKKGNFALYLKPTYASVSEPLTALLLFPPAWLLVVLQFVGVALSINVYERLLMTGLYSTVGED